MVGVKPTSGCRRGASKEVPVVSQERGRLSASGSPPSRLWVNLKDHESLLAVCAGSVPVGRGLSKAPAGGGGSPGGPGAPMINAQAPSPRRVTTEGVRRHGKGCTRMRPKLHLPVLGSAFRVTGVMA